MPVLAYDFDWSIVTDHAGELRTGLILTLKIAATGYLIAVVVGLPVALLRMSRSPLLRAPATAWVAVARGIPLFVVLFWLYYGAAERGWLTVSAFAAGALSLGLTGSGYMAEIYRGAIQAVDAGQREAAAAVGLSRFTAFRTVVFPQAVRIAVPPAVNLFVGLLKGATIVSVIGVADMIYVAQTVSLETFSPFELYTAAGLILVAVTLVVATVAWLLERWLGRSQRVA